MNELIILEISDGAFHVIHYCDHKFSSVLNQYFFNQNICKNVSNDLLKKLSVIIII